MFKKIVISAIAIAVFHVAIGSDKAELTPLARPTGNLVYSCVQSLKKMPVKMLASTVANAAVEQYLPKHGLVKNGAQIPLKAGLKFMVTALYHKTRGNTVPQIPALNSMPSWFVQKLLIKFIENKSSDIIQAQLIAHNIVDAKEAGIIATLFPIFTISPLAKSIVRAKITKDIIKSNTTRNIVIALLAYDLYNFLAGIYKHKEHASLKEDVKAGWENTYAAWLCTIIHKHTEDF